MEWKLLKCMINQCKQYALILNFSIFARNNHLEKQYVIKVKNCWSVVSKEYIENHHSELNSKYSDINHFNIVSGNIYSINSHEKSESVNHLVMSNSLWPHRLAHQVPLSMEFSRQGYWSGEPLPSPEDLSHLGIKPGSPTLQADS